MKIPNIALAAVLAAVALALGAGRAWVWLGEAHPSWASREQLRSVVPEVAPEPEHVGSAECQSCHPEAYRAWHGSFHRTMTQLATPEAVQADFGGIELQRQLPGHGAGSDGVERFRLSERDGGYWVSWLDAQGKARQELRAVMTTGSHHYQVVWIPTGQGHQLIDFPFAYLLEQQRWIPRRDAFLAPPDEPLSQVFWNDTCIECHGTRGRPRLSDEQAPDTRVTELGISCEACHGPGAAHVAANRWPWRRYLARGGEDPTITNPERLEAARAADVCGRCHSILSYPRADYWDGHWNDFLPGEDIESGGRLLIHPELRTRRQRQVLAEHERASDGRFARDRFWADGALRVAGRELNDVRRSPCFAGDEFSCLSCHSMHDYESPADQLARERSGDESCLQCHGEVGADVSGHTRHPVDSEGSRCLNCHMPYTTYGLLKAIRSHRVSSPSVATEVETGRPNACNACHLNETLSWTQAHLERDFGLRSVALDETASRVAAGPRWIATGDAGVRALAAWYFGWPPAREAASIEPGADWRAPYLAELLADEYAAVRAVAAGSLRQQPAHADLDYDFVDAGGAVGEAARRAVQARWRSETAARDFAAPGPLIGENGALDRESWQRLLDRRDTKRLTLLE